jgi:maltooligosyltrehalose trehalohydrolase
VADFFVWAPRASRMDVAVLGKTFPMSPGSEGWWIVKVDHAGPGDDYTFSIDSGPPLPDPRSSWQPHGVSGPSRIVDHQAFCWTDDRFQARPLGAAIMYELHVGTFTPEGTFDGVIGKLDHLKRLGITHIELMPIADFPGRFGWGYDGVSLYAPRHDYGGPEGLKRLIDACHAKGLGVILDVVYNHLGPSGNYLPQFGPYFSDRHKTPWGDAVNFDGPYSDTVRRYFCDNALMWFLNYHVDGLRLDAVHTLVDTSALQFLEQLATEVDVLKAHLGHNLILIAESDLNDPRLVRAWELGGLGLDAQWSDDFHHSLHGVVTGERDGIHLDFGSISDLAKAFETSYVYTGKRSKFRLRKHGRPPLGVSAHCFVAFVQNHDQLGNRAKGERLCQLVDFARARVATALVLTSPFIPLLFQGEEFAATAPFQYFAEFPGDEALTRLVSEGRHRDFAAWGWNPDEVPEPAAIETYQRSILDWSEVDQGRHAEMLDWHRRLIQLRRRLPQLTDGRLDLIATSFSEEDQWLKVERSLVTIVANFSSTLRRIPLDEYRPSTILLSTHEGEIEVGPRSVSLPGTSLVILGPERPMLLDEYYSRTVLQL